MPDLRAIVAANPATPAETLAALCETKDAALLAILARNPNMPAPLLLKLAEKFPHEFLANPALPLLQLAQPDFQKELSPNAWLVLLECEEFPPAWQQWLFQSAQIDVEQYGRQLQSNHYGPPRTFLPLLFLKPRLVLAHIRYLSDNEKILLVRHSARLDAALLHQFAMEGKRELSCAVARHACASAETLNYLVGGQPEIREAVARNPRVSAQLLHQLARDAEAAVCTAVAHHHATELADLRVLASDEKPAVRAAVALHYGLDEALYWQLAGDTVSEVRESLARNVRARDDALTILAYDAEPAVRAAVARNPRLPAELVWVLFDDIEEEVLCALAGNPRLPEGLYWRFANHQYPAVREQVARNPRTPLSVLEKLLLDKHYLGIARNPHATPAMLARLAQEDNQQVQCAVLAHKRTPQQVLLKLARDLWSAGRNRRAIAQALISNPHTPLEMLMLLPGVHGLYFLVGLANHPAVAQNRTQILWDCLCQFLQQESSSAGYARSRLSLSLLEEQDVSVEVLAIMARAQRREERYLVACHPRATREILEKLATDNVPYVRAAARVALRGKSAV